MHADTESFKSHLKLLTDSGISVIFLQTRETYRTQAALHEFAIEESYAHFRVWDTVSSWCRLPMKEGDTPQEEGKIPEPYNALKRIMAIDGNAASAWDESLCAVHYPHFGLERHPGMIQIIKRYADQFTAKKQVLILLVPEGYIPPPELQNDVALMDFPLPSIAELEGALTRTVECSFEEGTEVDVSGIFSEDEIHQLANSASGMTMQEAEGAFAQAISIVGEGWPDALDFNAFNQQVLSCKTDMIKRSDTLEMMTPVDISQVGGMDLYKEYLEETRMALQPEAADFGVDAPKGDLVVGPPGTGKSMTAKASAFVLQLPLVRLDISRCLGGLVGSSEAKMRSALKTISALGKCVVLVDEIDKAMGGAHSNGNDSGVSRRLLGILLTFMQESTSGVIWKFTANRTDALPPELVRRGRMDKIFSALLPNIKERMEVLSIHLKRRKQNPASIEGLAAVAEASRGYVQAELESVVQEAVKAAYVKKLPMSAELLLDKLKEIVPQSQAFAEDFASMSAWAEQNAQPTATVLEGTEALAPAKGHRASPGSPPPRRRVVPGSPPPRRRTGDN